MSRISFISASVCWLGWLWGRRERHTPMTLVSRSCVPSRSKCITSFCYISGWPGWRHIFLRTSSGIANTPCLVLYSCSWRIWPTLIQLVCGNPTITDESLSFILFYSSVQYVLTQPKKLLWSSAEKTLNEPLEAVDEVFSEAKYPSAAQSTSTAMFYPWHHDPR